VRAAAHVFEVALHKPDEQTAAPFVGLHVAECNTSFGIGAPTTSFGVHAPSLQNPPELEQFASVVQLPAASQVPSPPQLPD
jgi:hypothetical protein